MASTTDIILQLQQEIALRKSEIATFESIISQLSNRSNSSRPAPVAVVEKPKRSGPGRPPKNPNPVSEASEVVAIQPKRAVKGTGKVGRPKVRKRAKGTVVETTLRFLKRKKQFCEAEAIYRGIKSKHKEKTPEELYRYLTVVLSNLKRKGDLVSVKEDENGVKLNRNYWGLHRWVTKDGAIKPAFFFSAATSEAAAE